MTSVLVCSSVSSHRLLIALLLLLACTRAATGQIIPAPPKAAGDSFLPDAHAPFLDFSKDWPLRWVPAGSAARGVIVPVSAPACTMKVHFLAGNRLKRADDESDFSALSNLFAQKPSVAWQTEGVNATPVEARGKKPAFLRTGEPDASLVFRFVSGSLTSANDQSTVTLERTTFALYEPIDSAPTHLVVLLPGMFGTPQEILEPLIQHFRRSGFVVLRMFSHPSRFTEELAISIDPNDAGNLADRASEIAASVNTRIAECAYAVDAALDHALHEYPKFKSLPIVAFGGSGGAIVVPTVCALAPRRWSGALMVGAAADFWLVNQRSNYQDLIRAVRVRWTTDPTQAQRQMLDRLYLEHASLDPFHTARAMQGIPIFFIQGESDQAIPVALGNLLWERLQPRDDSSRRISTPLTHEALFATLPARFDEITDWIKARK